MSSSYYSFFPHLRKGLASLISQSDGDTATQPRAEIPFTVKVKRTKHDGSNSTGTATRNVEIVGPGDVTGLNSKAIIRNSPVDNDRTFEPNYLPFVEFYDEDFPWRYSPGKPKTENSNQRLRPWMTLAVLKDGSEEFEFADFQGILPTIKIKNLGSTLPPNNSLWAWAHVQVNDGLDAPADVQEALSAFNTMMADAKNADKALSRIISPRRLEANTKYHAFLIPTYEVGRVSGLGQEVSPTDNGLLGAWDGTESEKVFPYYYNWQFQTSSNSDFESLVDALETRVLTSAAVRREMDVQKPGNSLLDGLSPRPSVNVYGALKSTDEGDSEDVLNPFDNSNRFNTQLRNILNLPEDYQETNPGADPIITPPIYGKWAALRKKLENTPPSGGDPVHWFDELNLDPAYRAIAGLGANLVREKQEEFMDQAWKQVGDIMEANKKLRSGQMAEETSRFVYNKSVSAENDEQILSMAHNMHSRLKVGNDSVTAVITNSRIPNGCFTGNFRKLTARNGFLSKKLDANREAFVDGTTKDENIIDAFNTTLTTAPDYVSPSGSSSYATIPVANRTVAYATSIPGRPDFYPTKPGTAAILLSSGSDSQKAADYRTGLTEQHAIFEGQNPGPQPWNSSLSISSTTTDVKDLIKPEVSIKDAVTKKVGGVGLTKIERVMATPKIATPMYKNLIDLTMDGFMPNMKDNIPPDTITLLESNQKFIEAFFVGMNHEMARELLWREYPTDQRGTVFQQFWASKKVEWDGQPASPTEEEGMRAITPIHTWDDSGLSELGTNNPATTTAGNLVLAIRSELLKKYPNLSVFAQKAQWQGGIPNSKREFDTNTPTDANVKYPIFSAKADPDITFLGFDLTDDDAKTGGADGSGWFFVFKEIAGDIRFGLDFESSSTTSPVASWNDLHWGYMGASFLDLNQTISSTAEPNVGWNTNAAETAYILEQKPVIVGIHATDMLPE